MARQKEEVGRPFTVRIRSAQLAELEAWMTREGEAGLSHQKAILRLVAAGIHDVKKSPAVPDVTKEPAAPGEISAAEIAALEIAEKNQRIRRLKTANRELRRQLAERTVSPVDPLAKLSPAARAEFERLVASGGLERLLLKVAEKRAAPQVVTAPVVEKIDDRALQ